MTVAGRFWVVRGNGMSQRDGCLGVAHAYRGANIRAVLDRRT